MERIIEFSDFEKAVDEAYKQFKTVNDGQVSSLLPDANPDDFGIAVTFTDGRTITRGDVDVAAPLGTIAKIPVASILLSQNSPMEVMQKAAACPCASPKAKPDAKLPKGHKFFRAVSAIHHANDPDAKWDFIADRIEDLMGSAPELDDTLYKTLSANSVADNVENALAMAEYVLYDDAPIAIDLALRAKALKASARQLSVMGATIAADGVNPLTKNIVFDGAISQNIIGMMAAKGPHKMTLPWNVMAGLPAKSSFGGSIVGIFPGQFAIAAYSPRLNGSDISVRAAKAVMTVMRSLQLSVFQSAALKVK